MIRSYNGPVIIASPSGGVDIEEVAESTPDKVLKMPINIEKGVTKEVGEKVAKFLEFEGNSLQQVSSTTYQPSIFIFYYSGHSTNREVMETVHECGCYANRNKPSSRLH